MIVQLNFNNNSADEWCLLEFQGEITGDMIGQELGTITVKDVSIVQSLILLCLVGGNRDRR